MQDPIFYFTGTGNSLKIAKDISKGMLNAKPVSIAGMIDTIQSLSPHGAVGFVFPVYYCGLPKLVAEFIEKINLENTSYVYVVCVYGSTGGNAGCISQVSRLLKSRGRVLNAGFYIKSVDNFILWTWDVPPESKHTVLHQNAEARAKEISSLVSEGQDHFDKSLLEYVAPVVFRYGHFYKTVNGKDKAFYRTEGCNSCGLCSEICPTDNIEVRNDHPVWKSESCQQCLACLHLCPAGCIQYGKVTMKRSRYRNPYISTEELMNRRN